MTAEEFAQILMRGEANQDTIPSQAEAKRARQKSLEEYIEDATILSSSKIDYEEELDVCNILDQE